VSEYGEQFALALEGERCEFVVARDKALRVVLRSPVRRRPRGPRHRRRRRSVWVWTETMFDNVCRRPLISAQLISTPNLCVPVALTDLHKTHLNSVVSTFTDIVNSMFA
jgi:hypothetical protein